MRHVEYGTFCFDDRIVSNFISTPSGTTVIVGNSRFDSSFVGSNGACSFEQSGEEHFHAVFNAHVSSSSDLFKQEYRFPTECTTGNIIVCDTVMQFHQVNKVLQFQRAFGECTEEPAP
jgi:hypothetical protein